MKQDIENIIKKNLPEIKKKSFIKSSGIGMNNDAYKHYSGIVDGFNQAISSIDTSLIADEVLKKFIDYLELNPNEDGSTSPNIQHWIEKKQSQLRKLLSILSPIKENE